MNNKEELVFYKCPECNGKKFIQINKHSSKLCPKCNGSGEVCDIRIGGYNESKM